MADDFKVQFGVEFDVSDIDAQINRVNQSIKSKKVKMQAEFDDSLLNKLGLKLPFIIDLSVKLKYYNLVSKINMSPLGMVDSLWK